MEDDFFLRQLRLLNEGVAKIVQLAPADDARQAEDADEDAEPPPAWPPVVPRSAIGGTVAGGTPSEGAIPRVRRIRMFPLDLADLKHAVSSRGDAVASTQWREIHNGDECRVFRVEARPEPVVVIVYPAWRDADALRWTHALALHCAGEVPEVVAPRRLPDGDSLFTFAGHAVSLYPFVPGRALDTGRAELRRRAAEILADIHRAASRWRGGPRPAADAVAPGTLDRAAWPPALRDPDLEAWEASLPGLGLTRLPVHGDYYPRNVLATGATVTGVIDWDEADVGYPMSELAWSVWELCQNREGDELALGPARDFIDAYLAREPPLREEELVHLARFVRLRLRREILYQLGARQRAEGWHREQQAHLEAHLRAFANLRDHAG